MKFWQSTTAGGGLVEPEVLDSARIQSGPSTGLFETLRTEGVEAQYQELHLERLAVGLAKLELPKDLISECERAISAITSQLTTDSALGRLKVGIKNQSSDWTCFASWYPATVKPSVAVTLARLVRDESWPLAGIKSLNREHWEPVEAEGASRGFDETIIFDGDDLVSETTRANLLLVKQGKLVTPSLDSGCLPGVIRRVLLEAGVITESRLFVTDLEQADGMFLTSAIRLVQPVHQFEERRLPILESIQSQLVAVLRTRRRTS